MAKRVCVMKEGEIVETGNTEQSLSGHITTTRGCSSMPSPKACPINWDPDAPEIMRG